jgi:hypothetical protein
VRSMPASQELFSDLCFDVKCVKFYSRYFKKIIQERDILITQLSKRVIVHSIITGLQINHITGKCAFNKLDNLKLNN